MKSINKLAISPQPSTPSLSVVIAETSGTIPKMPSTRVMVSETELVIDVPEMGVIRTHWIR
jgi:hypothetical protein